MRTDRVERLLTKMREAEWTIERTANGHHRAKAPDGITVIHVPGKNGGGRSLANTEAMFRRWVVRRGQDAQPQEEQKQYVCETCGETFDSSNGFNAHRRIHAMYDVTCELCGRTYRSGNGITRHMRAIHKMEVHPKQEQRTDTDTEPDPEPEPDSLLAVMEDLLLLAARVERLATQDDGLRKRILDLLG